MIHGGWGGGGAKGAEPGARHWATLTQILRLESTGEQQMAQAGWPTGATGVVKQELWRQQQDTAETKRWARERERAVQEC